MGKYLTLNYCKSNTNASLLAKGLRRFRVPVIVMYIDLLLILSLGVWSFDFRFTAGV